MPDVSNIATATYQTMKKLAAAWMESQQTGSGVKCSERRDIEKTKQTVHVENCS